jgi:hypothetical protein
MGLPYPYPCHVGHSPKDGIRSSYHRFTILDEAGMTQTSSA